ETPETRLDGDRRLIEPDAAARLNPRGFSREDQARNLSCDPRSSGDWSVASGHDDRGVDDPSGLAGGPGVHRPGHLLLGQLLAEPGLEIAGSVLGCVARLNGRFGKGTIAAVLAGAETEEIVKNHLNASPLYGSLGKRSRAEIAACIKALVQAGCIEISKTGYPTLRLTEAGREVMRETA
ncbi:MAG TPA: RQC domain-containing protein, partial [Blastocatellia bacterium]|nr:RQC domain-containing protein [Blastocatellia bacterium]